MGTRSVIGLGDCILEGGCLMVEKEERVRGGHDVDLE